MQIKLFRWKAIGPLVLLLAIITVLVLLFAEPLARDTTEEVSTELLGTQVDVERLDLLPRQASVELGQLQVADPFEPRRNLLEADRILLKLNPEALAEKKLVIERFALQGMRFGTTRRTPARPVSGKGFAPQALSAVRQWSKQFDVPLLKLTPIDTIKQLVLDPTKLGTVQAAQGLLARTDSTRQALDQGFKSLDVRGTVDSARALADRLAGTDPRTLGLDGTRQAIQSVQATLKQLDATKQQLDGLQRNVTRGVQLLGSGVQGLDEARKKDYAFARSLLQLPTFSAPEIGNAFFGKVSVDRFQQALYWAELARHYMPPGLLPREDAGPKRLRASGTTVRFPKEHAWPSFLLELGQADFTIGKGTPLEGAYAASVQGLTSAPALYGKPMRVTARRSAAGSAIAGIDVGALIDHRTATQRDSVGARLRGVQLPSFDIPGLPFRIAPGTGAANLTFALRGDQLTGRWAIGSNDVAWALDSAAGRGDLEQLVWRVVSGLKTLDVTAEVRGTIRAPKLSVRSNLDAAIAARLQAVIAAVQADATRRVAGEQQRLDKAKADLEAQLKRLTAGLAPGIKLPKLKL
jgi:uncharacterized protein (TIGR03545 family)